MNHEALAKWIDCPLASVWPKTVGRQYFAYIGFVNGKHDTLLQSKNSLEVLACCDEAMMILRAHRRLTKT